MTAPTPWERLRSMLRLDGSVSSEPALPNLTLDGFATWAEAQGLAVERTSEAQASDPPGQGEAKRREAAAELVLEASGERPLGHVECYCTAVADGVVGVDVAVTGSPPASAEQLVAFLLEPVSPALSDEDRGTLQAWLATRLDHPVPYRAATTVAATQVALLVEDAGRDGQTWALAARGR